MSCIFTHLVFTRCYKLWYVRKKAGWILAAFFFAYNTAVVTLSLIVVLSPQLQTMTENNHITIVAPSPIIAVVILLYGGFTAFMCMHQIRAVFAVNTTTMLSTLGAALLAAILSGILILI